MNLRILESARNDLVDGRHSYERQGQGPSGYFLDSIFSDTDSLAIHAGIHRKVFGFYRMLSRRFPDGIYYQFNGQEATVYRVVALRQNPR